MTSTWALIVVLKIRSNTAFEGLILLISDDVKELMNEKILARVLLSWSIFASFGQQMLVRTKDYIYCSGWP